MELCLEGCISAFAQVTIIPAFYQLSLRVKIHRYLTFCMNFDLDKPSFGHRGKDSSL